MIDWTSLPGFYTEKKFKFSNWLLWPLTAVYFDLQSYLELKLLVPLRHSYEKLLIGNHSWSELVVLNHGLSCLNIRHLQKSLMGEHIVAVNNSPLLTVIWCFLRDIWNIFHMSHVRLGCRQIFENHHHKWSHFMTIINHNRFSPCNQSHDFGANALNLIGVMLMLQLSSDNWNLRAWVSCHVLVVKQPVSYDKVHDIT